MELVGDIKGTSHTVLTEKNPHPRLCKGMISPPEKADFRHNRTQGVEKGGWGLSCRPALWGRLGDPWGEPPSKLYRPDSIPSQKSKPTEKWNANFVAQCTSSAKRQAYVQCV